MAAGLAAPCRLCAKSQIYSSMYWKDLEDLSRDRPGPASADTLTLCERWHGTGRMESRLSGSHSIPPNDLC